MEVWLRRSSDTVDGSQVKHLAVLTAGLQVMIVSSEQRKFHGAFDVREDAFVLTSDVTAAGCSIASQKVKCALSISSLLTSAQTLATDYRWTGGKQRHHRTAYAETGTQSRQRIPQQSTTLYKIRTQIRVR